MTEVQPKVRKVADKAMGRALGFFDCVPLMLIIGGLALLAALRMAVVAGQGGAWVWWLLPLLALLAALFWIWMDCGREALSARDGHATSTGDPESGTAVEAGPGAVSADAVTGVAAGGATGAAIAAVSANETRVSGGSASARAGGGRVEPGEVAALNEPVGQVSPRTTDDAGSQGFAGSGSATASDDGVSQDATTRGVVDAGTHLPSAAGDDDGDGDNDGVDRAAATGADAIGEARAAGSQGVAAGDGDAVSDDHKPGVLTTARGGAADDLKKISGVGPKMEDLLNGLGFYHFDQIAGWSRDNVAWVEQHLDGFNGRIDRDDWVGQAGVLARGGATEFSERVARGEVESSLDDD